MNKKYFKLISGTILALCLVTCIGLVGVFFKDVSLKKDSSNESAKNAGQKTALSETKKGDSSQNNTTKSKEIKSNKKAQTSQEIQNGQGNQSSQGDQSSQGNQSSQKNQSSDGKLSSEGNKISQGSQGSQGSLGSQGTLGSQESQGSQEASSNQGTSSGQGTSRGQGTPSSQGAQESSGTSSSQVAPQWLYYNSRIKKGIDNSAKPIIDEKVKAWTNYQMSDTEIFEWLDKYICEELGGTINSMGVMSNDRYLIPDINSLPNYDAALSEGNYQYCFTGVYTKGEYNEYGDLICYMWQITII